MIIGEFDAAHTTWRVGVLNRACGAGVNPAFRTATRAFHDKFSYEQVVLRTLRSAGPSPSRHLTGQSPARRRNSRSDGEQPASTTVHRSGQSRPASCPGHAEPGSSPDDRAGASISGMLDTEADVAPQKSGWLDDA
jgi:hypothetical protein